MSADRRGAAAGGGVRVRNNRSIAAAIPTLEKSVMQRAQQETGHNTNERVPFLIRADVRPLSVSLRNRSSPAGVRGRGRGARRPCPIRRCGEERLSSHRVTRTPRDTAMP
ncbi:hypothetical protein EVAR_867_1 [Eumeta japonica]|uniref:Uncharacterized protein n=1 Tax=Eumeta variegata TaxID=151549 RepID=A0A4C1SDV2_EUMVA|nr:hypothetical protein EVAR_867_1 [Eumeta japonica]